MPFVFTKGALYFKYIQINLYNFLFVYVTHKSLAYPFIYTYKHTIHISLNTGVSPLLRYTLYYLFLCRIKYTVEHS